MQKKRKTKQRTTEFYGPAALMLPSDNGDLYLELRKRVHQTIKPADALEDLWVRDVVDRSWEIFQYRRIRANRLAELQNKPPLGPSVRSVMTDLMMIERLTVSAEKRRNQSYREIEGRRELFANRLRKTVEQIEAEMQPKLPAIENHSNDNVETIELDANVMQLDEHSQSTAETHEEVLSQNVDGLNDEPEVEPETETCADHSDQVSDGDQPDEPSEGQAA